MTKIAVICDPHLKCEGNKRDDGTGLNARFLDRVRSLEWAVNDARERRCEWLLFGGDLFDTCRPAPYQIMAAIRALQAKRGMRLVGIPGNHDMPRCANEDSALGPVFSGLDDARLCYAPEVIDCGAFSLVTLPYPRRSQLAASVGNFSEYAPEAADKLLGAMLIDVLRGLHAQCDPAKPSILLGHCSIDVSEIRQSIMAERDICLPLRQVPGFTFGAFGHIHAHQDLRQYGRPNFFHVGGTDRADFGEEGDPKYYVAITIDEAGERHSWQRVEIPCREYRTFHIDLHDNGSELVPNLCDAKDAICRVKLTRPEHVKPDLSELETTLRQAGCFEFYGVEQDVVREAAVRSTEIAEAKSGAEMLRIWHEAKRCQQPLDELLRLAEVAEAEVGI